MLSYRVYITTGICKKIRFVVRCNAALFDDKAAMKQNFYTEEPTHNGTIKN
jgi:hypothetical protein